MDVGREGVDEGATRSMRHSTIMELAALDKRDLQAVLRHVLAKDAEVLDVERVNCWALDESGGNLRCVAAYDRSTESFDGEGRLSAREHPEYFRAILQDPLIITNDTSADDRTRVLLDDYLAPKNISSLLDVPVWVGGRLWGVVCHEHVGAPRHWDEGERDFALSIGHIVSMALESHERANSEQAMRLSELFIGILSHDLRNPLSVISSALQLLIDGATDEANRNIGARALSASRRIERMVEQLLDFTRIRLGPGLPVKRVDVDLGELSKLVIEDLSVIRPDARIDLVVSGDVTGSWDEDRLWQLMANLVSNAVDHSHPGSRVEVRLEGDAGDRLRIIVKNTGRIPEEIFPMIFEPFRMMKEGSARRGLGLGLFISREVVNAHGGSIAVDTGDDETVFEIELPRKAASR